MIRIYCDICGREISPHQTQERIVSERGRLTVELNYKVDGKSGGHVCYSCIVTTIEYGLLGGKGRKNIARTTYLNDRELRDYIAKNWPDESPSIDEIANKRGLSVASIRKRVHRLSDRGFVTLFREKRGSRRYTCVTVIQDETP